ncbi:MAG: alpha/beta hydrolase [Clostridia bacterium]|nr:alpha/beta hydrolase [Clostridia bacterium]
MEQCIPLWPHLAPYTDQCPGQAQPSLTAFSLDGARGAVVIIPGGGYSHKAEHEGAPIARMLNSVGIAAYVLNYRVHPCPHEAPLADARRAIRVVRSLGYEKVAVLGFSAGGHLCCAAATKYHRGDPASTDPIERLSSRPDAFIPCYAVVTFGKYTHLGSRQMLLGDQWQDEALAHFYSNEEHITEDTPPAFLWHTAEDGAVPVQNSLLLAKALADHGVPFEMHVYPKGRHGLGLAQENAVAAAWGRELGRYLLEKGYGA